MYHVNWYWSESCSIVIPWTWYYRQYRDYRKVLLVIIFYLQHQWNYITFSQLVLDSTVTVTLNDIVIISIIVILYSHDISWHHFLISLFPNVYRLVYYPVCILCRYYRMMIPEEFMINMARKDYRNKDRAATLMCSPGTLV